MFEGGGPVESEGANVLKADERRAELATNLKTAFGGRLDSDFDLGQLIGLKRTVDENGQYRTQPDKGLEPPGEWLAFRQTLDTTSAGIVIRALTAAYRGGISTVGELRSVHPEKLRMQRNINAATVTFLKDAFQSTQPPGEAMRPEEV